MTKTRHEDRLVRWAERGEEGSPLIPAATVIAIRDGQQGLETLMLRRNSKIVFGAMWVFPGGRVDPEDQPSGEELRSIETARNTAVREASEEANLALEPADLLPFSHWTPPPTTPKRFDTWFFLAATENTEVLVDGGEIKEYVWKRPAELLSQRDEGKIEIAPPTWVSLYELSAWKDVQEAMTAVATREPERFETRIAVGAEGPSALWTGDAAWPEGDATEPGPRHRLNMHEGHWYYERSS